VIGSRALRDQPGSNLSEVNEVSALPLSRIFPGFLTNRMTMSFWVSLNTSSPSLSLSFCCQSQCTALDVAILNTADPRSHRVGKGVQEKAPLPFDSRVVVLGRHETILHRGRQKRGPRGSSRSGPGSGTKVGYCSAIGEPPVRAAMPVSRCLSSNRPQTMSALPCTQQPVACLERRPSRHGTGSRLPLSLRCRPWPESPK